jgi:hypothetical protein
VRGFDYHRGGLHDWLGDRMGRPEFEVREVTAEVFPLDDLDLSPAPDPPGRAQRRLRRDPASPEGQRPLGV